MRSLIRWSFVWVAGVLLAAPAGAQTLDIYFIDTEGGQATLYVSPTGESMLVDTGNPGERDHSRIREVMDSAGVTRIDHLVVTHYHGDHHGGVELLAEAVPVGRFYDHGQSIESGRANVDAFQARYAEITSRSQRSIVKPGDRIPFAGVEVLVVASHGEVIDAPLQGARGVGSPNPACESFTPLDMSNFSDPDNDMSVGTVISYGMFRTINLGDLTRNWEQELMCPNKIGHVDLYLTSHHGLDRSGSEVLVHGLRPRVAVMNNGTRKGGSVAALRVLHSSPGLEDVWQLHWSYHGLAEQNAPGMFIANLDAPAQLSAIINPPAAAQGAGGPGAGPGAPGAGAGPGAPGAGGAGAGPGAPGGGAAAPGAGPGGPGGPGGRGAGPGGAAALAAHTPAYFIKVSARSDGSFTVTNTRNGFTKTYEARSN